MADRARRFVERVWYGDDGLASAVRTVLLPAERLFGAVVGARDLMYDAGWLATAEPAIPALSVGNLSVGGTGKTPIAAWIARELAARGAHPAIVLRGYGDDEPLVHRTLNPAVPVVVNADRVAGIAAAARGGAEIAVLDDAFQHRRARRVADLVLVSADRWNDDVRLLPAGPWREPLRAVRRATLVVVTRKAASDALVDAVNQALARTAPSIPRVTLRLAPSGLVRVDDPSVTLPIDTVRGRRLRLIAAIADPAALVRQLQAAGGEVDASLFPDHHAFTDGEIAALGALAAGSGAGLDVLVVCTLKDAVKLAPRWPRLAAPLWYVSQQVMVERGVGGLEHVLDELARTRSKTSITAG